MGKFSGKHFLMFSDLLNLILNSVWPPKKLATKIWLRQTLIVCNCRQRQVHCHQITCYDILTTWITFATGPHKLICSTVSHPQGRLEPQQLCLCKGAPSVPPSHNQTIVCTKPMKICSGHLLFQSHLHLFVISQEKLNPSSSVLCFLHYPAPCAQSGNYMHQPHKKLF